MISFYNISKTIKAKTIIYPLDLSIKQQKTTMLLGPSGSGKSTLLRMIIGLVNPDTGSININHQKLNQDSIIKIRQTIGYVIQEGGLFPHLNAEANITLLARHLGQCSLSLKPRVHELCDLMRLPISLLNAYPAELSGGQRQRISLMRALMLDPEILLLDEPLGALDPMVRFELQLDLKHIFSSLKKTVVMVSHDMSEAKTLGDHAIFMSEGRVLIDDQMGTVAANQNDLVARFFSFMTS